MRWRAFIRGLCLWLSSIRMQLGALASVYGMGISLLVGLHYFVGERWGIVALFNDGAHWLTLGAVFCLPVVIVVPTYRWIWLAYTLPAALAFLIWYGRLFLPSPQPQANHQLTVMTWNVANLGISRLQDPARSILDDSNADIVGLQEYNFPPFAEIIQEDYPYTAFSNGLGIWSRYPIIEFMITDFEDTRTIASRAVVDVDGFLISVYIFHPQRAQYDLRNLSYDDSQLKHAVPRLIREIQQDTHPTLVLCDCNFSDRSSHHQDLAQVLEDSWQERGFGFGLTAPFNQRLWPIVRSDYVWHSAEFATLEIEVMPDSTSDHLPVRAVLGFDKP